MEKFKRFLKVFCVITLILGVGAYFTCLGCMPERTKAFTDIVIDYLNKPLGIAFGVTITLGGIIYFFVAYTSVGKKALNYLKGIVFDTKAKVEQETQKAKEYYELTKKKEEEIKVVLSGVYAKVDNLTDLLVKVCYTSPNAKINALGEDIANLKDNYKQEINTELAKIDSDVDKYIEEKVDVKALANEIEELKRKLEESYGEETTNDKAED